MLTSVEMMRLYVVTTHNVLIHMGHISAVAKKALKVQITPTEVAPVSRSLACLMPSMRCTHCSVGTQAWTVS